MIFHIQVVWYSFRRVKVFQSTYILTLVLSNTWTIFVQEDPPSRVRRIAAAEGMSFSHVSKIFQEQFTLSKPQPVSESPQSP